MPDSERSASFDGRVLVKLRPAAALRALDSRAGLTPLRESADPPTFALTGDGQWFAARVEPTGGTPWDLAHGRIADQLGIDGSDIEFAEPDLVHDIYVTDVETSGAVGAECEAFPQDNANGKPLGPGPGWHLGDDFSQLASARDAVSFSGRRTRIAHLDTGYYARHGTTPTRVLKELERNFVERDGTAGSAEDPDNRVFLMDASGHGTGTLSILAGAAVGFLGNTPMGGAPDADVVPLRIADRVVLLRTSAFARALHYAVDIGCDVLSMSMGGLPSRAWRDTIDRAYLAGLCMVTAAGNNKGVRIPHHVVYPARYSRVMAACGVMADGRPYTGLDNGEMEGCYGPDHIMRYAMAAYTPNVPWAVFGCPDVVRHNGAGTSSATPQIAAAAALWLEKYKHELPRDWRRIEAVRNALFKTARTGGDAKRLGRGILRARDALAVQPDLMLPRTKSDSDSFAWLRILTGLGAAGPTPREQMFNLELAQRWLLNPALHELIPEMDGDVVPDRASLIAFTEAVIADHDASVALRRQMAARYGVLAGRSPPTQLAPDVLPRELQACDAQVEPQTPAYRRLRVYALDPSFSTRLETAGINDVTLHVRWEPLKPGPTGEYLKVTDIDAIPDVAYPPVDLDDPRLLAQDGWSPAEGNAQFHQQMVYAVAMKTIEHFERALGRPVLWRHRYNPGRPVDDSRFVQRLEVRPHALRQANAFYSPSEGSLKFGYFELPENVSGDQVPGSRVFACLSHDIIAHETTHAILDGMHHHFGEPTNPDVLAFHEGFADIVALLQHFMMPDILRLEISRTRGDIEAQSLLGSLAVQFGRGAGSRGALREAIGSMEDGVWRRLEPDPSELQRRSAPHARGAILVAAVFDAFIAIYQTRTRDLLRIHTGGSGVLPAGAIHPDLANRLSDEAARTAGHVLNMCIRALDYLPPVDVTFFEYLRAVITADYDIVREDRYNYRVAFVEAFRRRGIRPLDADSSTRVGLRTFSVDTLRWHGLEQSLAKTDMRVELRRNYNAVFKRLRRYADECLYLRDRKALFRRTRNERRALHERLSAAFEKSPEFAAELGLEPGSFEVHQLRSALRSGPDGTTVPQVIVSLTQSARIPADAEHDVVEHVFRGGSTLVVDLAAGEVRYQIRKRIGSTDRRARTAAFLRAGNRHPFGVQGMEDVEPFALLHITAEH